VSPLSELECRIVSFFLHARNLECLEEPQWLKQARGSGNTLLESGDWSNDEDLDIPSTLQLDYRIVEVAPRLGLTIEEDERGEDNFESLDDLLLHFDGLNWQ
jgi:hypothetical protein